jgi:hypothetical protein
MINPLNDIRLHDTPNGNPRQYWTIALNGKTRGAQGRVFDGVSGIRPGFAVLRQLIDPSVPDALEIIEV